MERRYYTSQPAPAQPQLNIQSLLIIGGLIWLFVQYSSNSWPFEKAPVTPIVIDDRDQADDQDVVVDPAPSKKAKWVVVVHESDSSESKISLGQQKVLSNYSFWFESLPKLGVRHRIYDDDDKAAESWLYRAKAANIESPFVIVVDDSGGVVGVIPLPESTAEIEKLVK